MRKARDTRERREKEERRKRLLRRSEFNDVFASTMENRRASLVGVSLGEEVCEKKDGQRMEGRCE